jgi:DNA polymerase-1
MTTQKPLLLVDGSYYLHRAFNALPSLTTRSGTPTGAIYGVISMLRKLLKDHQPDYIAVVFDAPGKTFRHDLFQDYKANRPPLPEELSSQIDPLHRLIRAMGLPLVEVPDVEADDVIATLANQAIAQGMHVIVLSGDKDLAQLVNTHISLLDSMRDTHLDQQGVMEKYGVPPAQIVDYLALIGDSSDNIPGVLGVGPKTAAKWLKGYGSLDAIIAHADAFKGQSGENLRGSLAQLPRSRQLVTLRYDVELALAPAQLKLTEPDSDTLQDLFNRYEFNSWVKQLDQQKSTQPNDKSSYSHQEAADYQIIYDEATLHAWLDKLRQAKLFAFDTETTHLDYMQAHIVGVSFAVHPQQAAYIPLTHDYPGAPQQLDRDRVLEKLRPLLEDPQRAKLGQNLKYDCHVLLNHGIHLTGIRHDTMLESYVLDSTATRHNMDSMAEHYLGLTTIHYEDVAGKGVKQLTFNQVPIEQAGPYAAEDADITLRLHQHLWPKLANETALRRLYEAVEIPLICVLTHMEHTGVQIDSALLRQQSHDIAQRLSRLEQEAYTLAGQPFNLGSPKQLQYILFEKQGLPITKKTPKGQPSTSEDVLQELAMDYPLPRLIIEHRGLSKLKSTYTDRLPLQVQPHTGRVHTSYHQAVTSTGRLSSSDPNLQNIPIRTPEGRRIRQAFVAPPGYVILAADYSQIELRIMAHLSGDPGLLQAFKEGADIHQATAAEVFGVSLDSVEPHQRRAAKAINFGLMYGMSAFGLARQLGIERSAAQAYVDRYFTRYTGVKTFMEQIRQQAAECGYVETGFGRRLYLPDINSRNTQRRQAAERTAINAPMQGTAADIIKRAMLSVHDWLSHTTLDGRMVMQVHDELVFEIAEEAVDEAKTEINGHMVAAAELQVPLEVDIGIGRNWDEAH